MSTFKIVILDHSTAEVHIHPYDPELWEDVETFLGEHCSEHGETFLPENCSWMVVDTEDTEGRLPLYIY